MRFLHYPNINVYIEQVLPFLEQQEAANNLMIGLLLNLQQKPEEMTTASLYAIKKEERVVLAAMRTSPDMPFLVFGERSCLEEASLKLCEELKVVQFSTEHILGPDFFVKPFARVWKTFFRLETELSRALKVFRLDQLKTVRLSDGKLRAAEEKDISLLTDWRIAFDKEAFSKNTSPEEGSKMVVEKVESRDLYVWEVDSKVVTMVARARPTRHGITVNYVYTPPQFRKRGYATSCVATLSQYLLDSGYDFCSLFTDASNPTSNKIYQSMGYQWVADFSNIKLKKE